MAIYSYDIVSTLQALGMMKYWKGKHIILKKQVLPEFPMTLIRIDSTFSCFASSSFALFRTSWTSTRSELNDEERCLRLTRPVCVGSHSPFPRPSVHRPSDKWRFITRPVTHAQPLGLITIPRISPVVAVEGLLSYRHGILLRLRRCKSSMQIG